MTQQNPAPRPGLSDGTKLLLAWVGAVVFAVAVIWVVVYLYSNDIIRIAGPFAVIGLLPLLLLLRVTFLRSRINKNGQQVGLHLNRTLALVQAELSVPPTQRPTRGSDASLLEARSVAEVAARLWHGGQPGQAVHYIGQLSNCARGWDGKAPLTKEVIGALRSVQKQIQAISESQDATRDGMEDQRR